MNKKEDIIDLGIRKIIYNYILEYPGLHFRELCRKLNLSRGTLEYHLKYLKKNNYIYAESHGRYKRYYPSNKIRKSDKKVLNLLRQKVPRKIILHLLAYPNSSLVTISKNLNKNPRTIKFHLNKFMGLKFIEEFPRGNEILYKIDRVGEVLELLITYKGKLFDKDFDLDVDRYDKNLADKNIDNIIEVVFEILPHPYHP